MVDESGVKARNKNSGLASTAKVFRSETREHKMMEWSATWMWRSWGTVGWSLFNQGWFKSRAVSSRKQGQRVSSLGWATIQGFICKKRRMRATLQSTTSFFLFSAVAVAQAQEVSQTSTAPNAPLKIEKQLKMMAPEKSATRGDGRDQRVLDAAKMYERYFLGQMMKAMRSTVAKSDLEKTSMGENIYREQLDDQYVESWSDRGGIGLADMIHDELMGKAEMLKRRKQAMRESKGKARTPMALTDRDVLKVRQLPSVKTSEGSVETVLVSLGQTQARPGDTPETVRAPWAGRVVSVKAEEGKVVIGIATPAPEGAPAGLAPRKMELAFDGVPAEVTEGDEIEAGHVIGRLGKGARGILVRQTLVQVVNRDLNKAKGPNELDMGSVIEGETKTSKNAEPGPGADPTGL